MGTEGGYLLKGPLGCIAVYYIWMIRINGFQGLGSVYSSLELVNPCKV